MSPTPSTTSTLSSSHGPRLSQKPSASEEAHAARTDKGAGGNVSANVDVDATAKDARAREHARQRTKTRERREHALARERKEKTAAQRVLGLKGTSTSIHGGGHGHGGSSASKLVRRLSMESWDGELPRPAGGDGEQQPDADAGVVAPRGGNDNKAHDDDHDGPRAGRFTELTLGDILSKPRQLKVKQLDFEMIPPIRTVIALDDADADEPWEYITRASANDGSAAWKSKSYAQAVVSAM